MRAFGNWVLITLAIIGGLTCFAVVSLYIAGNQIIEERMHPEPKSIDTGDYLVLELDQNLTGANSNNPLTLLTGDTGYNFTDLILTLRRAAQDPKVGGVIARLGGRSFSPAKAQELADAMAEFRKSGKPTLLYSESLHGGLAAVAVASSFQQIWLQPSGMLGLQGLAIEAPYIKSTLNEYGVEAEFIQRHEYKGAMEFLTHDSMTPPVHQNMSALLNSLSNSLMGIIATDRDIPVATVKSLAETGPLMAQDAKQAGLIDHLGYTGDFNKTVKETFKGKAISIRTYANTLETPDSDRKIALITASGEILPGQGEAGPFANHKLIFARPLAKAIRDAAKDKVGAIILRINSPGGDYAASDTIHSAILDAQAVNIPVIVSMGDTAASGGYFIAAAADTIVAEPTTITGSIGVLAGKVSLAKAWEKLGISWTTLKTTETADMWSANHSFTPAEMKWMNHSIDTAYADFTGKVAKGRKLTPEAVDAIARGRVFSGQDAKAKGLVDDLGGLEVALAHAKRAAGVPATEQADIVDYPRKRPFTETVLNWLKNGDSEGLMESKLSARLPEPLSTLHVWTKINMEKGAAVMPPLVIY